MRQTKIFKGTTKVFVPWKDTEGMKQWTVLTFTGDAESEKLLAEVRKFIRHNFKKRKSNKWILNMCRMWNSEEEPAPKMTVKEQDKAIEDFIQRIQSNDEDEVGTHTDSETPDAGKATGALPTVPTQD